MLFSEAETLASRGGGDVLEELAALVVARGARCQGAH